MDSGPLDSFKALAGMGREALRRVWEARDRREALEPTQRHLLELLEAHPQFRPFWEGADPEPGENPFLHVALHEVLERQLAVGEPPQAGVALERLVAGGVDPHEARHRVLEVLAVELFRMIREQREFDRPGYAAKLESLGPPR